VSDPKPWGPLDPNSQHQLWSRWTVTLHAMPGRALPSVEEIADNARRFFVRLFRSTIGRVRADIRDRYVEIVTEIEGPAAHDPALRAHAILQIREHFIRTGFGRPDCAVTVGILAGDCQDGTPPAQLIVMPNVISTTELFTA
jgi:hypothetical protein